MSNQHHTIIVVPNARARLRKYRVSNLQIGTFLGAFLLLTLTATYVAWAYFTTNVDQAEIEKLRQDNVSLREVNRSFETGILNLEQQLGSYEDRTRKLAIVAGLDDLSETTGVGIGGEPVLSQGEVVRYDLSSLESRAGDLDGRLDQIQNSLEQRLHWISSTPAISPVKGILTSGFGYRRDPIHGARAMHQGIDIAAAPGQPVKASADGIVVRSGHMGGLGKAVYVSHGYGLTSRYGHLSRIDVKPGQKIKRGDVVGTVGNSGRSTGYHLHYEVHLDGRAVNPLAYILDSPRRRRG